jgi:hypothetical protein
MRPSFIGPPPPAATKVLHKHQPCFVDFLRTPPFVHFFWAKSF